MLGNYLQILKESLEQKKMILTALEEKSREQSDMIAREEDFSVIDKNMTDKDNLITALIKLDSGFEALYSNIKSEINEHKSEYTDEIKEIQQLITDVMDKSATIEAIEQRNKAAMEMRFAREKKEIQHKKSVSNVAYDYYKVTNNLQAVSPQFMDTKK